MRLSNRVFYVAVSLLFLGVVAAEAQGWAGRGRLQGIVTGPDGKPIKGAKVTLTHNGVEGQGPEPMLTNKRGRWGALGLASGSWKIVIEAEGLKPSEGTSPVAEGSVGPAKPIQVQLREFPKEVKEAAEGPDLNSMIERGNALMVEEKWAEARAEYEEALVELVKLEDQQEATASVMRGVARAYYSEGNSEMAITTLEETLELNPGDQESLRLISTLLVAQGEEEKAQTYADQITDGEFKFDPNSLLNLGIQHFNDGDVDKALEYFERVVAENPEIPEPYYYRGLSYLGKGKIEEAKADFQKLLEIAPDHPKAGEAKEFLEAL